MNHIFQPYSLNSSQFGKLLSILLKLIENDKGDKFLGNICLGEVYSDLAVPVLMYIITSI